MPDVKKPAKPPVKRKAESMYEEVPENDTIRIVSANFTHMKKEYGIFKSDVFALLDKMDTDMMHMQKRINAQKKKVK